MHNKKQYTFWFAIISLISVTSSFWLSQIDSRFLKNPHFWLPTIFFIVTTLLVNLVLTNSEKGTKEFVFKTLALSMARLLLCMVFVLVYSLINKPLALSFTSHFMLQYVIFTVFEIVFLLKYIKQAD